MHVNPVEHYRAGGEPALTVILVHGRALTPDYMRTLARRIGLSNIDYVLPRADGNTWYPGSFLAPIEENEPQLSAALEHYEKVVTDLIAAGTDPERIVVGGFSQGACLTAEYLVRFPRPLAGAILWTGGLIGPPGTSWKPCDALIDMLVYVTTSRTDPFVPVDRVRETRDWALVSGAAVDMTIFDKRDHEVCDMEIDVARSMLERLL